MTAPSDEVVVATCSSGAEAIELLITKLTIAQTIKIRNSPIQGPRRKKRPIFLLRARIEAALRGAFGRLDIDRERIADFDADSKGAYSPATVHP